MDQLRNLWYNGPAVLRARWSLRSVHDAHPSVRVWGRPRVRDHGGMTIAKKVRLSSDHGRIELICAPGATLSIGEGTYINHSASLVAHERVTVGARCHIGPNVMVTDNSYHRIEPDRRDEMPESRPVTIGDNVWLGARVIVLPGITIGDDAVIGAGSVVSRDIPARSLAAGAPARVIRTI